MRLQSVHNFSDDERGVESDTDGKRAVELRGRVLVAVTLAVPVIMTVIVTVIIMQRTRRCIPQTRFTHARDSVT